MGWGVIRIRKVLKRLVARNQMEQDLLNALVGLAESVVGHASDLAVAASLEWERVSASLPESHSFPEVFNSVPEDVKNDFYLLVEAVQVFRSIHGPKHLEPGGEEWLVELKRIRDLCTVTGFRTAF
jgi:hypothetical protein